MEKKLSAREQATRFLDGIDPVLQSITALLWPEGQSVVSAARVLEHAREATRLEPLARDAKKWLDAHHATVQRRLRTKGRLSAANQTLVERLNNAELTLRSFILAVDVAQKKSQ
jgi:hypothetical protein